MNVLFINDSTSNPNWGDRAAAIALKKMVTESGGNIINAITEEDLKRSLFNNNDNYVQEMPPDKIKEKLKLFIPPVFLKIRQKLSEYWSLYTEDGGTDFVPDKWEDFDRHMEMALANNGLYSDLLKTIELSDLAVIHGDGCMVGNTRIARAELFLSYLIKKQFNKSVIIVNHTADFDHPVLHRIAQEVYPLLDDVVFRDSISAERCKDFCNGRAAADSAFLFKPVSLRDWLPVAQRQTFFDVWPDTAQFDPAQPYICLGGSSIFSYSGKPVNLINGFSALTEHLRTIYSGQIVLTVSDLIDQEVIRPVAKKLNLPLIGLTTPIQQAVDILGNAEAYIGGRWHPSIFSLRGGTPIIPISSKTFKMQALGEMSGLSSAAFDALNLELEKEAIGHRLISCLDQGNELRRKLRSWAEKEFEKSWDNVRYLKNCQ